MCNGGTFLPCGLRPIAHGSVVRREAEQRPAHREARPSMRRRTWAPTVAASGCTSRTAASAPVEGDWTSRQALLECLAKAARQGALGRIRTVKTETHRG